VGYLSFALVKQERPPKAITWLKNIWLAFCRLAKTNDSVPQQKAPISRGIQRCVSSPLRSEILVFAGEIGNFVTGDLGRTGTK
jgi:hypothetical protein